MSEPCTITGTVIGLDSETPVKGATVEVVRVLVDDALVSPAGPSQAVTEEDGTFSLKTWPNSTTYVRCWQMGGDFATLEGMGLEIPGAETVELKDLIPARDPLPNSVTQTAFNNHMAAEAEARESEIAEALAEAKAYTDEHAGTLDALADDPSPELGGDLNLNGHNIVGEIQAPLLVLDGGLL